VVQVALAAVGVALATNLYGSRRKHRV
jgi:hypothetical protein